MDRYFTREWMTTECTMDQLMQTALKLDKNYPPSCRSHNGDFHAWRRGIGSSTLKQTMSGGGLIMNRLRLAAVGSTGIAAQPNTTVDRVNSTIWLKNQSPNRYMAAPWSSLW